MTAPEFQNSKPLARTRNLTSHPPAEFPKKLHVDLLGGHGPGHCCPLQDPTWSILLAPSLVMICRWSLSGLSTLVSLTSRRAERRYQAQFLISYCPAFDLWTPIIAPHWQHDLKAIKMSRRRAVIEHPFLLNAEAVGGSELMAASDPGLSKSQRLARIQTEDHVLALRRLHDEIDRPDFISSDALIQAIAILVAHGRGCGESEELYPNSPLATLQILHLTGKRDWCLSMWRPCTRLSRSKVAFRLCNSMP
jgi:hypothetical protein